jgi:hypothetical protein
LACALCEPFERPWEARAERKVTSRIGEQP